jgi:hypothetical protein
MSVAGIKLAEPNVKNLSGGREVRGALRDVKLVQITPSTGQKGGSGNDRKPSR